jgi:hypothetical protein
MIIPLRIVFVDAVLAKLIDQGKKRSREMFSSLTGEVECTELGAEQEVCLND